MMNLLTIIYGMKHRRKSVFITGASSGMGRATALYLADQGFDVYAGTRTPDALQGIEHLMPIALDIQDPQSIQAVFEPMERIDVLINNAGYGLVSTVEDVTESEMVSQFDVNVFGLLRVTQAVIPKMRAYNGGVIINVSSFLGKVGLPLFTLYNASKYAVEGITDSLRYELRDFNIRVHSILPGFFATKFARDNLQLNEATFDEASPYRHLVSTLAPTVVEQINEGNDPLRVARLIKQIIEDPATPARQSVGDKAAKFIPMRRELSDEEFERRVREYYGIG